MNEIEFVQHYQDSMWNLFKEEIRDGDPDEALVYLSGKLCNEAIELFEVYLERDDRSSSWTEDFILEAGDVQWYISNLFRLNGIKLSECLGYGKEGFQQVLLYDIEASNHRLILLTGELLGLTLKKRYHGKPVEDRVIINYLHEINEAYLSFLFQFRVGSRQVMEGNLDKLQQRHGSSYNADFYTNPDGGKVIGSFIRKPGIQSLEPKGPPRIRPNPPQRPNANV